MADVVVPGSLVTMRHCLSSRTFSLERLLVADEREWCSSAVDRARASGPCRATHIECAIFFFLLLPVTEDVDLEQCLIGPSWQRVFCAITAQALC